MACDYVLQDRERLRWACIAHGWRGPWRHRGDLKLNDDECDEGKDR